MSSQGSACVYKWIPFVILCDLTREAHEKHSAKTGSSISSASAQATLQQAKNHSAVFELACFVSPKSERVSELDSLIRWPACAVFPLGQFTLAWHVARPQARSPQMFSAN